MFDRAVAAWKQLVSDPGAKFDQVVELRAEDLIPQVTWGTSPGMVTDITGKVPDPKDMPTPATTRGYRTRASVHGTHGWHVDR